MTNVLSLNKKKYWAFVSDSSQYITSHNRSRLSREDFDWTLIRSIQLVSAHYSDACNHQELNSNRKNGRVWTQKQQISLLILLKAWTLKRRVFRWFKPTKDINMYRDFLENLKNMLWNSYKIFDKCFTFADDGNNHKSQKCSMVSFYNLISLLHIWHVFELSKYLETVYNWSM